MINMDVHLRFLTLHVYWPRQVRNAASSWTQPHTPHGPTGLSMFACSLWRDYGFGPLQVLSKQQRRLSLMCYACPFSPELPRIPGCRYILAYLEQNVGIKRGQRIWQLGFGGGFKANSAVWRARRDVSQTHPCWAPEWPAAPHGSLFGT